MSPDLLVFVQWLIQNASISVPDHSLSVSVYIFPIEFISQKLFLFHYSMMWLVCYVNFTFWQHNLVHPQNLSTVC